MKSIFSIISIITLCSVQVACTGEVATFDSFNPFRSLKSSKRNGDTHASPSRDTTPLEFSRSSVTINNEKDNPFLSGKLESIKVGDTHIVIPVPSGYIKEMV